MWHSVKTLKTGRGLDKLHSPGICWLILGIMSWCSLTHDRESWLLSLMVLEVSQTWLEWKELFQCPALLWWWSVGLGHSPMTWFITLFYSSFHSPISSSLPWAILIYFFPRDLSFADFLHLLVIHDAVALENSTLVSSSVGNASFYT